jgi:hypothetical protein
MLRALLDSCHARPRDSSPALLLIDNKVSLSVKAWISKSPARRSLISPRVQSNLSFVRFRSAFVRRSFGYTFLYRSLQVDSCRITLVISNLNPFPGYIHSLSRPIQQNTRSLRYEYCL